jgi:hypothetical protein
MVTIDGRHPAHQSDFWQFKSAKYQAQSEEEMSLVELEVANPVAASASVKITPAVGLSDLANKRSGRTGISSRAATSAWTGSRARLSERYPSVTFRYFQGAIGAAVRHLATQQADDTAAEFDAVVGTTGD